MPRTFARRAPPDRGPVGLTGQGERLGERGQRERVAVRAGRRARAAPADPAEVVAALGRGVGRHADAARERPVDVPAMSRTIQCTQPRASGSSTRSISAAVPSGAPDHVELGRAVLAVAGVPLRDRPAGLEGGRGQREVGHRWPPGLGTAVGGRRGHRRQPATGRRRDGRRWCRSGCNRLAPGACRSVRPARRPSGRQPSGAGPSSGRPSACQRRATSNPRPS